MAFYVYLIQNILDGKAYIGKSKNIKIRWSQHISKSKKKTTHLYNAIKKYGKENFSLSILKECSTEEICYEYERVLISLFKLQDKNFGYNIADGGKGSSGFKVKEKTKLLFKEKYTGSKSVRALFTDDEIVSILECYSSENYTAEELSLKYGCGKSTIIRILSGESYSNIQYDRSKFPKISNSNRKKAIPSGEEVKSCKLTDLQVQDIREKYKSGKYSYSDLAKIFKVSKTNISLIIRKKSRK